jgi:hypothetical protein
VANTPGDKNSHAHTAALSLNNHHVQDCDAQLQRALNKEDFELAQALRAQRTRVDEALVKVKAFREAAAAGGEGPLAAAAGAGGGGTPSSSDSIEEGLAALRLRSELAVAVEEEE